MPLTVVARIALEEFVAGGKKPVVVVGGPCEGPAGWVCAAALA